MNAVSLVVFVPLALLAAGAWAEARLFRYLDRKAARR